MNEEPVDTLLQTLNEQGARYVVGAQGRPLAVLLTLEEYAHFLDLLDDERDSQDPELEARLRQAAGHRGERRSFPDYVDQRESAHGQVHR